MQKRPHGHRVRKLHRQVALWGIQESHQNDAAAGFVERRAICEKHTPEGVREEVVRKSQKRQYRKSPLQEMLREPTRSLGLCS